MCMCDVNDMYDSLNNSPILLIFEEVEHHVQVSGF